MVEDGIRYSAWMRGLALSLPAVLALNSCESPDPTDWRTPMESQFTKMTIEDLREHAEQNDYLAMFQLGRRYDTGMGVKQNPREAASWYRLAAENGGLSMAANNLGCLYRDGRGVTQDYKTASMFFRSAGRLGNRHAKKNLAWLYERRTISACCTAMARVRRPTLTRQSSGFVRPQQPATITPTTIWASCMNAGWA